MSEKERLTVDLDPEQKQKLRLLTAFLNTKHMQRTVIQLIEEKYESMQIHSVSAEGLKKYPGNHNYSERNLQT